MESALVSTEESALVSTEVSMDLDPTRIPKRQEPLNLLTGVFLKSVFFIDPELSKCVMVGFFKNRGDSLGLVFRGKRGGVFWSFETFNQFVPHFNEITMVFSNNDIRKYYKKSDFGPEDVKVINVFGRRHVFLYDGEHTLSLNAAEWDQFVNNLPLIYRELKALFPLENSVKDFAKGVLCSDKEDEVPVPIGLPANLADRLFDELMLYKRWPNGGSS